MPVSYADGVEPVAEYAPRFNVPQAIAAPAPDGEWNEEGWLFVATEVGRGVSVFDLKTLQPIRFLYSPDSPVPHHPYISPDQRWVIARQVRQRQQERLQRGHRRRRRHVRRREVVRDVEHP